MVGYTPVKHVRHRRDRALRIRRVVVPWAGHTRPVREQVDLPMRVREAEGPPGDDGYRVVLVVDALEVGHLACVRACIRSTVSMPAYSGASSGSGAHLCVEERRPRGVSDSGRAKRDRFDVHARGQVERHEHRVELGERAPERVPDLMYEQHEQSALRSRPWTAALVASKRHAPGIRSRTPSGRAAY